MKVRLTFKSFTQELWISSVSNTQKIPYASIRKVTSEPIKGQEEYHIMVKLNFFHSNWFLFLNLQKKKVITIRII